MENYIKTLIEQEIYKLKNFEDDYYDSEMMFVAEKQILELIQKEFNWCFEKDDEVVKYFSRADQVEIWQWYLDNWSLITKNKLLENVDQILAASLSLLERWDHDLLNENYPFVDSFEEVIADIKKWRRTIDHGN